MLREKVVLELYLESTQSRTEAHTGPKRKDKVVSILGRGNPKSKKSWVVISMRRRNQGS